MLIMINLIGLSGRKQSGKTELANVLKEYGYQVINFADQLKDLVCTIIGCTLITLNKHKETESEYELSDFVKLISLETKVPENKIFHYFSKPFKTIREILQVLGTNIIREHNPDWHIIKTKERLIQGQKYVFADCRFPNEKKMIESMGGEVYFVIRPENTYYSNHISEVSLRRNDFRSNNIILNNVSKEKLIICWKNVITSGILLGESLSNSDLFYKPSSINSYAIGMMIGNQQTNKNIKDSFMTEDLKYWNVSDKIKYIKPDILDYSLEMVSYWLLGILDTQRIDVDQLLIKVTFKNQNLLDLFIDNITFNIPKPKNNKLKIPITTFINWLSREIILFGLKKKWKKCFL